MNTDFKNSYAYGSFLSQMVDPSKFYSFDKTGSTAIGWTWENLNGVATNNLTGSDLKGLELKAKRDKSKGVPLTLFTANPTSMGGPVVGKLVTEYGKPHRKRPDEMSLHKTMKVGDVKMPNGHMVELALDCSGLTLRGPDGDLASWSLESLAIGASKIETMSLAYAQCKMMNGFEHFRYHTVYHYDGLGIDGLIKGLEEKKVVVEFRASYKDGALRDRGTAFRIAPRWLDGFYSTMRKIW